MNGYTTGWIGWIVWFVIEEALALFKGKTADTLSGHVWSWFATGASARPGPFPKSRHAALLMGMVWLTVHLVTGGRL